MDMKLNGKQIRALRLQQSWSQEKLAEVAGLHPRTVQRAEAEGTGSLTTRLNLAKALGVAPTALDRPDTAAGNSPGRFPPALQDNTPVVWMKRYIADRNLYQFTLQLLVTVIYLAAMVPYFSDSRNRFSWINYSLGRPLHELPSWWLTTFAVWLVCVAGWLLLIRRFRPSRVKTALKVAWLPLLPAIARLWYPALVLEVLAAGVYFSVLLLLVSLYLPPRNIRPLRLAVQIFLLSYVCLWYFQPVGEGLMVMFTAKALYGIEYPSFSYFPGRLAHQCVNLLQLIPAALVLILSLDREKRHGGTRGESRSTVEDNSHPSSLQENSPLKMLPAATRAG